MYIMYYVLNKFSTFIVHDSPPNANPNITSIITNRNILSNERSNCIASFHEIYLITLIASTL